MENWKLRRAQLSDAAALAECFDKAYAIYASRIADLPAVSEGIEDEIVTNLVWVAVRDDQIIGGLVLSDKEDHVMLANVAVDPMATGKGLGRALMILAETETRRLGKQTIRLSAHIDIPENVQLYQHLGWHETKRSGNTVSMEKLLTHETGR